MEERLRGVSESEALQELAMMGYIGGSSSAQRRSGVSSFSGKVPPGKGRKGKKNTRASAKGQGKGRKGRG